MTGGQEFLTAPQVGRLIGRTGQTVNRMAAAGKFPVAQRLPGRNGASLFRKSDIVRYLDDQAAQIAAAREELVG